MSPEFELFFAAFLHFFLVLAILALIRSFGFGAGEYAAGIMLMLAAYQGQYLQSWELIPILVLAISNMLAIHTSRRLFSMPRKRRSQKVNRIRRRNSNRASRRIVRKSRLIV